MPKDEDSTEMQEQEEVVVVEEPAAEAPADDTPLSAEEVDLESQRLDESSSLASDRYDNEGNRVA